VELLPPEILRELIDLTRPCIQINVICGFAADPIYCRRARSVVIVGAVGNEISLCSVCCR